MKTWVRSWREDPRTRFWFFTRPQKLRITEATLQSIKAAGTPDDVVTKLRPLVEQDILAEEFAGRLNAAIGEEATALHLAAITEHALQVGDRPLAARSYPAQLSYQDLNPIQIEQCAARKEFCPAKIHFEWEQPKENQSSGAAGVLTEAGVKELETAVSRIAKLVPNAAGELRLKVRGFADNPGSTAYNRDLSRRRAEWVLNKLKDRLSPFPFKEVETVACGEPTGGTGANPDTRYAEVIVQPK